MASFEDSARFAHHTRDDINSRNLRADLSIGRITINIALRGKAETASSSCFRKRSCMVTTRKMSLRLGLFRLSRHGRWRGDVVGQHANAPGIAVTLVHGSPVSVLRVAAPLPECPRQVARDVNVNALDGHVGHGAALE